MVDQINTTENQIFEAALKVFHKKGLAGARMQEIADEAGINKSMLHYYFRSKEQLFAQVFIQSFKKFMGSVLPLLNEPNTWEEKIPVVIEHYAQQMRNAPDLALFVINEMRQNSDAFLSFITDSPLLNTVFVAQLKREMSQGIIRNVHPIQIWITITSGIIFPFITEPMLKVTIGRQGINWEGFIEDRKKILADMVIKYLKDF
jgi:TetR/AcrR family transcriptional regulator